MKNPDDPMGNRNRDLPVGSTLFQPTVPGVAMSTYHKEPHHFILQLPVLSSLLGPDMVPQNLMLECAQAVFVR